ncbi:MAG: heterodisulfide reductase-related iron-sulfur binding cluster [Burkholderiaceae bacterium]
MSVKEGSLEAPTRHPIDWREPSYYDERACQDEMERVFDICHGCRRCVSLCNAFPTLFDLVDESETMEVDGVDREDYWKVVDQCYLCDVCYMTKCPYVPPHPWNVDFPHLMLRGKAIRFRAGNPRRFRDGVLSSTDRNGRLASIPIVVHAVNAANRTPLLRKALEGSLGVHRDAWLPEFASPSFRSRPPARGATIEARDGARTPGKVAIFTTCYVNYNEPGIGRDLAAVLEHNGIPWILAEKEYCCGMPKLELGDLESVARLKAKNIPRLARLARDGHAILAPIPSCALMFKQELPLMFPEDQEVLAVRDALFDPFEYFVARHKDGLLRTDFSRELGKVSYHVACHLRVQNIGQKTRELLQLVPATEISTIERCSGHAGTWGVKKEFHETAMKIGRPVFRAAGKHPAGGEPDWVASDCQLAGHHIAQGLDGKADDRLAHPLTLLRMAYGLD